jgi:hypothetical protein
MTKNRKPKYVPLVDAAGNYTIDDFVAQMFPRQKLKDPPAPARGPAFREPPEPPPEEEKPVCRRSQLLEQRPLRGSRKPDPESRDSNT